MDSPRLEKTLASLTGRKLWMNLSVIKTHTTPARNLVNEWANTAVKRFLANQMPSALTEYDSSNKIPKYTSREKEMPNAPFHSGKEQTPKTLKNKKKG